MKAMRYELLFLLPFLATSCGLMEMENQEEVIATQLQLERDSVWIMVGDEFTLQPVITPENATNNAVAWSTNASDVLSINDNVFSGASEGWAHVYARNIVADVEDSCVVCVMRRWEDTSRLYPYEMVVYASVSVNGQAFDPETMMVGAFVNDEMRGIGTLEQWKDHSYVRFRVGSHLRYFDPEGICETVDFRVYYRQELRYKKFPQTLDFDGETHGTLSDLFTLKIE